MFLSAAAIGGALEISDEGRFRRRPLLGRHLAGEATDLPAADRHDVVERLLEQGGEFLLAARQWRRRRMPPPSVPGAVLMPSGNQPAAIKLGLHRRRRMVVGKCSSTAPSRRRPRRRNRSISGRSGSHEMGRPAAKRASGLLSRASAARTPPGAERDLDPASEERSTIFTCVRAASYLLARLAAREQCLACAADARSAGT